MDDGSLGQTIPVYPHPEYYPVFGEASTSTTPGFSLGSVFADFFGAFKDYWYAFFYGPVGAILKFLAVIISVLATFAIIYYANKISALEKSEERKLKKKLREYKEQHMQTRSQQGWLKIGRNIEANNEAEWRLAILEADTLLDNLLTELGYVGASVGDKLKTVKPEKMRSLDAAWEAHKVRNRIAHDGNAYPLTYREAKRVIGLYEQVFREFGYI